MRRSRRPTINRQFCALFRGLRETSFAATLIWVCLLASTQSLAAAVPDWVKQAASQPLGKYPPDTNAVVLFDDTECVVTGPGDYIEHHRRVVKILRPEGRNEGKLTIYLDGKYEKLLNARAWTIDSLGHEFELKDRDFVEGSNTTFELYSDSRFRQAEAPAASPGSTIVLDVEVRRHDWWNLLNWVFQEDVPVKFASFSVELPAGWEMKSSWAAATPVDPVATNDHRWTWTVRDLAPIQDEPMMPSGFSLAGRMALAYFAPGQPNAGSWKNVGLAYLQMTNGRRDASTEISDRVRQLVASHPDFDGRIRALSTFVQSEIRYVAIEIGIGGYQPHAAAQVFRARYGDCKDKATLLSSMLHEAGISSEYVIIHTKRGVVQPDMPSPWFNHVILAIQLPPDITNHSYRSIITTKDGKRYLVFDPTDEYTPVGQLRGALQNTYALLVTDAGGELIETPLLAPELNTLAREGHFTLDSMGTLTGEVIETRGGDYASEERAYLIQANQGERTQRAERRLNHSLQGFTLQALDIKQLQNLDQSLVLSFRFTAPQYAQLRGPLMLVRPRVIGEKSIALDRKPRHHALEFDGPSRETDSFEIEIPSGFVVDDIPDSTMIDTGFARYQSHFESSGNKLRYTREYVIRDIRVAPEKIEEFRNLQGRIGADEFSAVVLKHP